MLQGVLNANRLDIVENGSVVRFGGGVSMTLQPGKDGAKDGTMDGTQDNTKAGDQ
jgi:hypothetical protein